jgi:NAD(P)-dependent dehydrogenase (short-subunit alcohol dehydrogenase family)
MAKTVLVTGGTLRLGRVIADHLRRVGWRVITTSHRADAGADVVADFSDPMGAVRAYAATLRLLDGQPPDALVNNAALFTGDEATLNAVNFEAPKKLTMLMAGRETGVGSVVNILDSRILRWGQTPSENWGQAPYEKTKLALLSEMRRQAAMFAETLRVNAVAPGPVLAPTGVREKAGETLLGRPAPEDVAEAVAYLLTAKSTTGAILPVDGGHALLGWGQTPLD